MAVDEKWARDLLEKTTANIRPMVINQIETYDPLFALLAEGRQIKSQKGGDGIAHRLEIDRHTNVGSYSKYDTFPQGNKTSLGQVWFPWRQTFQALQYCGYEECVNNSPQAIVDSIRFQVESTMRHYREWLSEILATSDGTGNDNKDPFGLPALVGGLIYRDNGAAWCVPSYERQELEVVGTVNPELGSHRLETYKALTPEDPECNWWSSYVEDFGLSAALVDGTPAPEPMPLTFDLIDEILMNMDMGNRMSGRKVILLSKDLYRGLRHLVSGYNSGVVSQNGRLLNLGFDSFTFQGLEFVWSRFIPADTMYILNLDYLEMTVNSNCFMKQTPWKQPSLQDASYMQVLSMFNFTTNMRKAHAVICNLKPVC